MGTVKGNSCRGHFCFDFTRKNYELCCIDVYFETDNLLNSSLKAPILLIFKQEQDTRPIAPSYHSVHIPISEQQMR